MTDTQFPNYLAMRTRVPLGVWRAVRVVSVATLAAIVVAAVAAPSNTLTLFWGVLVPLLPLVFLVVPGAWRNVCPLAALNQASRNLGVSGRRRRRAGSPSMGTSWRRACSSGR